METSGTPPVRAGYVQNADGSWSPLTGDGAGTTSTGGLITNGTPTPIGIMAQNTDGTWSGWSGGSGATTPPEQVYPPAGIAVSTGTAWDGSIPAADVALLDAANTFTTDQSINGNLNVGGNATVDGAIQAGSGPALYLQTPAGFPNIHSDGASLFINATNGGGTHINADEGFGCYFHAPGGAVTATIDSAGNATFAGTVTSGVVDIGQTLQSLQARIAALEAKLG